jgi:hypothetical protein
MWHFAICGPIFFVIGRFVMFGFVICETSFFAGQITSASPQIQTFSPYSK